MNKQLEEKWKSAAAPFDECCLYVDNYIRLSELRILMAVIIETLKRTYSATPIYSLDDWHEHDGYLSRQTGSSLDIISEILASDESLYAARPQDDFVRRAYYGEDFSFLFRFYIQEPKYDYEYEYPDIWGDFDLCASSDLIDHVKQVAPEFTAAQLVTCGAKEYFDRRYVG